MLGELWACREERTAVDMKPPPVLIRLFFLPRDVAAVVWLFEFGCVMEKFLAVGLYSMSFIPEFLISCVSSASLSYLSVKGSLGGWILYWMLCFSPESKPWFRIIVAAIKSGALVFDPLFSIYI